MRYLYGDSSPFPQSYDFLATLESFMATATRVVQLALNAQHVETAADQGLVERMKGLEQIEQFHTSTVDALQEASQESDNALVRDYAGRVIEHAVRVLADNKARAQEANEREQQGAAAVAASARNEIGGHLDTFMRSVRLPTERTRVKMSSSAARTDALCWLSHPLNITCEFEIDIDRASAWGKPRKVSEFTTGVDLMIGAKKAWFSNMVTPERIHLDDYFLGEVDITEEQCMLLLRKKADQPEAYVFTAKRINGMLEVRVDRPQSSDGSALGDQLDPTDLATFERLFLAILASTNKLTSLRSRLRGCLVDATNALDTFGAIVLVERLVSLFAPTVAEIAARSPNQAELSLKRETDDGKREELYLRRDDIRQKLEPLPADGRNLFAPLGLLNWLPGTTMTPPPVSTNFPPRSG